MKRIITVHLVLRFAPLVLLALLILSSEALDYGKGRAMRLCCYFLAAAVIYLAYPLSREDAVHSVRFCVVSGVYYLVANIFATRADLYEPLFILPTAILVVLLIANFLYVKYKDPASLFRKDAQWCSAEEDSRVFFSLITLLLVLSLVFISHTTSSKVPIYCMMAAIVSLDVVLHCRAYTGRTMILGHKKEKRIQNIMIASGHGSSLVSEVETGILEKSYRRVEQLMKEKKPYLSDKFTLEEMSDILKINKVYISRAVNKFTGKNFRQYVNWHRVLYAAQLMKADPWLKVIELAFMSGFHSQVTFNLSFRMFLDEAPSDMLVRLRLSKPRPSISKIEVKLPSSTSPLSSPDERI